MKIKIAFILLFVLSLGANAQDTLSTQLTFAYYGNFAFEQGGRIGSQLYLKQWNVEKESKVVRKRNLFLQPNIAFVSRPLFYSNFQLSTDVGIRQQKTGKKLYHGLSFGLGYLARLEVVSFTVDFKGEVIARDREVWDYLLPMLSYEVGKDIAAGIGWYAKFNYGIRYPIQESQEKAGMPLLEVGMKLPLRTNNHQ